MTHYECVNTVYKDKLNFKKPTVRLTEGDEGGGEIIKQTRRTSSPHTHARTHTHTHAHLHLRFQCKPRNVESRDPSVKQLYTGDSEGVLRGLSFVVAVSIHHSRDVIHLLISPPTGYSSSLLSSGDSLHPQH